MYPSTWTTACSCGQTSSARSGQDPTRCCYPMAPMRKAPAFKPATPQHGTGLAGEYPEVTRHTTNKYQNFEVIDPERWVPHGYGVIRVDSRGAGRSPGYLNPLSARETQDLHDCIEWARTLPWCNGKVGLAGISYYAQNQWQVAATQPPHLAAMSVWEGGSDWYRELARHGGILSTFGQQWYDNVMLPVQYGRGTNGLANPVTGQLASGDLTLDEQTLAANRIDYGQLIAAHVLDDDTTRERGAQLEKVTAATSFRRQLGRPRPAPARKHRRVPARLLETQVARGARPRALGRVLHRLWRRAAAPVLRPFPARQGRCTRRNKRGTSWLGAKPYGRLKYRNVNGKRMAYVDEGQGDAIFFAHGNPTSSYLWRNVMPHLQGLGRLVAADMNGMGGSDKLHPSASDRYNYAEQRDYLFALWDALDLGDNVTLVPHDWGSASASTGPTNIATASKASRSWKPSSPR